MKQYEKKIEITIWIIKLILVIVILDSAFIEVAKKDSTSVQLGVVLFIIAAIMTVHIIEEFILAVKLRVKK